MSPIVVPLLGFARSLASDEVLFEVPKIMRNDCDGSKLIGGAAISAKGTAQSRKYVPSAFICTRVCVVVG